MKQPFCSQNPPCERGRHFSKRKRSTLRRRHSPLCAAAWAARSRGRGFRKRRLTPRRESLPHPTHHSTSRTHHSTSRAMLPPPCVCSCVDSRGLCSHRAVGHDSNRPPRRPPLLAESQLGDRAFHCARVQCHHAQRRILLLLRGPQPGYKDRQERARVRARRRGSTVPDHASRSGIREGASPEDAHDYPP